MILIFIRLVSPFVPSLYAAVSPWKRLSVKVQTHISVAKGSGNGCHIRFGDPSFLHASPSALSPRFSRFRYILPLLQTFSRLHDFYLHSSCMSFRPVSLVVPSLCSSSLVLDVQTPRSLNRVVPKQGVKQCAWKPTYACAVLLCVAMSKCLCSKYYLRLGVSVAGCNCTACHIMVLHIPLAACDPHGQATSVLAVSVVPSRVNLAP